MSRSSRWRVSSEALGVEMWRGVPLWLCDCSDPSDALCRCSSMAFAKADPEAARSAACAHHNHLQSQPRSCTRAMKARFWADDINLEFKHSWQPCDGTFRSRDWQG
jgi:hypothetical protein